MTKSPGLNKGFSSAVQGWDKKSDLELACLPKKVMHFLPNLLLLACGASVCAADGYEAIGHITFTRFGALGQATHKKVMMFDVKVQGSHWRIRTEPVIEGRGVGFYEASCTTNDFVLKITGLDAAYRSSESPFRSLRSELKESKKDDVFFANPLPVIPAAYSNSLFLSATPEKTPSQNGKPISERVENIATAVVLKGKYPPSDPSYIAFVWFAFTAPSEQNDGQNKMLLQVWDDGNPQKRRFRRARWNQFREKPQLLSSAEYDWIGKELLTDGKMADINTSDVSKPQEMAARYNVDGATNVNGLMLPVDFSLTRFMTKRSSSGDQQISSTLVASVVNFNPFDSGKSLEVAAPGKTFVSDYRISGEELRGAPLGYFLDSTALPAAEQLKQSSTYRRSVAATKASPSFLGRRLVLLAFLFISTLVGIAFLSRLVGNKQISKVNKRTKERY